MLQENTAAKLFAGFDLKELSKRNLNCRGEPAALWKERDKAIHKRYQKLLSAIFQLLL